MTPEDGAELFGVVSGKRYVTDHCLCCTPRFALVRSGISMRHQASLFSMDLSECCQADLSLCPQCSKPMCSQCQHGCNCDMSDASS